MSTADGSVLGTTQIVNNGAASQKWNMVILGDGYRAAEMTKYHTDVQSFVQTLFTTPPFDELWCALNIFRVDVTSTDSGADDPAACGGSGATARTYFDASFCNNGIRRLLVCNDATVHTVVNAQVPQAHMIMVIVNSTVYGGSGGGVATFSLAPGANEIGLHEMGHTAFGFADEYEYYAGCGVDVGHDHYAGGEPSQPNVTKDSNRATNKWRDLVAAATPMPTTSNADCSKCDPQGNPLPASTVGAYEGAFYYHCGAFRAQFNCRMRALGNPYCAVCQRVIRQTLAPFMVSWTWGTSTLNAGQTQRWWLWWPGYPGLEVIGVQVTTPGAQIQYDTPGMQMNADGSATYFLTIRNVGAIPAQFHFRGSAV
jgi:IgA peptidase M64